MKKKEIIVLGSDHAGFTIKEYIRGILEKRNYPYEDMGVHVKTSADYPDYAEKVALRVRRMKQGRGILMCSTGIGASIAANKIRGIRAALVHSAREARLSVEHNNANILVLGGRSFKREKVKRIITTWLTSKFKGGRHTRRIDKITKLEKRY